MNKDIITAQAFAALGHPNRLRIVELLRAGERCNCEIQPALGLEQSNLSRHVKVLLDAGIILGRRDGIKHLLRIADERIFDLIDGMDTVIARRASPNAASGSRPPVVPLPVHL